MTSKIQRKSVSLNTMVGGAIAVWAVAFASVYGPFVFGYIGMHAVTTGVFLLAVRRADRKHADTALEPAQATASAPVKKSVTERRTTPQPVA